MRFAMMRITARSVGVEIRNVRREDVQLELRRVVCPAPCSRLSMLALGSSSPTMATDRTVECPARLAAVAFRGLVVTADRGQDHSQHFFVANTRLGCRSASSTRHQAVVGAQVHRSSRCSEGCVPPAGGEQAERRDAIGPRACTRPRKASVAPMLYRTAPRPGRSVPQLGDNPIGQPADIVDALRGPAVLPPQDTGSQHVHRRRHRPRTGK